jgi:hypothetical protein
VKAALATGSRVANGPTARPASLRSRNTGPAPNAITQGSGQKRLLARSNGPPASGLAGLSGGSFGPLPPQEPRAVPTVGGRVRRSSGREALWPEENNV